MWLLAGLSAAILFARGSRYILGDILLGPLAVIRHLLAPPRYDDVADLTVRPSADPAKRLTKAVPERSVTAAFHSTPPRSCMQSASVCWSGDAALITIPKEPLRLEPIANDPRHWAVFDGSWRVGVIWRRDDDTTAVGEQLLIARLARLFDSLGEPARWERHPSYQQSQR
jgi:hypothetical protein